MGYTVYPGSLTYLPLYNIYKLFSLAMKALRYISSESYQHNFHTMSAAKKGT